MNKERLKEARQEKSWSQKQLAGESKVAVEQISRYESGKSKPNRVVLEKIAGALNVSIDYLSGLTNDPTQDAIQGSYEDHFNSLIEKMKSSSLTIKEKKMIGELIELILIVKNVRTVIR